MRRLLLLVMLLPLSATAEYRAPGCYFAAVNRVVDGDTIAIDLILLGTPQLQIPVSIRARGIDTPESGWRAKCAAEAAEGIAAKDRVVGWLRGHPRIVVCDLEPGKYSGRLIGDIYRIGDPESMSQMLINRGLARAYDGGKRAGWCG